MRTFINRCVPLCCRCINLKTQKSFYTQGNLQATTYSRDPFAIFRSKEMQVLLRNVTGFDLQKINSPKQVTYEKPIYKLLTDAQLKEMQEDAIKRAQQKLQMPPVMKAREAINKVLSIDSDIADLQISKFIAVDISYGVHDKDRTIVVREVDGTLRHATWEERDRMNQMYNPKEGRDLYTPEMFQSENLERMLSEKRYMYILDRACVQFEPDDPMYIQVCHRTYEVISEQRDFDILRSTRHFGPMVFYLAWFEKVGNLLGDCLVHNLIDNAIDVIGIYHLIYTNSASIAACESCHNQVDKIQAFVNTHIPDNAELQLLLQKIMETQQKELLQATT